MKRLKYVPSTFEIALALSFLVYFLAILFTKSPEKSTGVYAFEVLKYWQNGFWELLEFTLQMVLILVFGYALAISKSVNNGLKYIASFAGSNTKAVLVTGSVALLAGYINWGFGLVLGAVLARRIGESDVASKESFNYPLIAASGYLAMLVWHGGLSGSAPLKTAETNHFLAAQIGVIPVQETLFSSINLQINAVLVMVLVAVLYFLSLKKSPKVVLPEKSGSDYEETTPSRNRTGWYLGGLILLLGISDFFTSEKGDWGFVDLNFVNFILLGAGLIAFKCVNAYFKALGRALGGAVDIIVQFPFYAGILGIMKYSGLLVLMADNMITISGPSTFPILSFFSAAVINLMVPSGGGQWALQGPVIMEAALKLGLDPARMVMVFSYGDQLTNMLQPFWALPLLAITGVSAGNLFRYTVYFFFAGLLVFGLGIFFLI